MVDWLHISQSSGSGDTIITVTADTYTGVIDRLTSLVISGRTKSVTVPVEQLNRNTYEYLTFTFTSSGNWTLARTYANVSAPNVTIEFSKNGGAWTEIEVIDNYYYRVNVVPGDVIRVRGSNPNYAAYGTITRSNSFQGTASFNVSGNIMSLVYGDDFADKKDLTTSYTFSRLFQGSKVESAADLVLPATGLTELCYFDMFNSCSAMTETPKSLPASTLAQNCYQGMFGNCFNIEEGPQILATTMAPYACRYMFVECESLTTAPQLPAMNLAEGCYFAMFEACDGLTTAPVLPATTMADHCYSEMFISCRNLVNAPVLSAMTLADGCYSSMFHYCYSLQTAPSLPATTLTNDCYNSMFYGCSGLTTAQAILPATTLTEYCYSGMFMGCTSLTTAPVLPAPVLATHCYDYTFVDCSNLNYIKCLATDISASRSTFGWVRHVAATGTFVKAPSMNDWTTGDSGIPTGWNVIDDGGFYVSPTTFSFDFTGGTSSITITSESDWTITKNGSSFGYNLFNFSQTSGHSGTHNVTITCDFNPWLSDYYLQFNVSDGTNSQQCTVSIDAVNFSKSPSNFTFDATGGTSAMTVSCEYGTWEVMNLPAWVTASPSSGGTGTTTVTLTASANPDTSDRTVTAGVGWGQSLDEIYITQLGQGS